MSNDKKTKRRKQIAPHRISRKEIADLVTDEEHARAIVRSTEQEDDRAKRFSDDLFDTFSAISRIQAAQYTGGGKR